MPVSCTNTVPVYLRPTEASGLAIQSAPENEAQGRPRADSLLRSRPLSLLTPLRYLRYAPSDNLPNHDLPTDLFLRSRRSGTRSQEGDPDLEKDAAPPPAGGQIEAPPLDGITEEGTEDMARLDYQSLGTPPNV